MYQIAICEDEPVVLEQTRVLCGEILNELGVMHEISLFTSAEALERVLDEQSDPFQLLILDIQLGAKSGLTLAKELYARNSEIGIIFMTNCRDFAEEGYDAHPIHFLVKPVDRTRLTDAIKIDLKRKMLPQTVVLNSGRKVVALSVKEIHYIESRNHTLYIYKERDVQELRMSLSEAASLLPIQFQRCHASYLVNLQYVTQMGKSEVVLQNGIRIPISRTYSDRFATAYLRYFNAYLS